MASVVGVAAVTMEIVAPSGWTADKTVVSGGDFPHPIIQVEIINGGEGVSISQVGTI